LTVGQAVAVADGTEVQVRGVLIEDGGTLFVAEALAESYPPQPGGATIEVDGFDITTLDGLESAGPVRWLDRPTTLTGVMVGGRLTGVEVAGAEAGGG
jgi:hypothetical protein